MVDDDATVNDVVAGYLQREGYLTEQAHDGIAGLDLARGGDPDLVVLDLMLPGLDGLEVCRRLRADKPDLPIIMLTARGEAEDRVAGLEVGADDYVVKPFSPRELALRVRSVLRRSGVEEPFARPTGQLVDGDLRIDLSAHRVWRGGDEVSVTVREFDLLVFLVANAGQAFTREELMRRVWGWQFGDMSTITVHVRRLREKVEPAPSEPVRLVTVWGVGYRWDAAQ